MQIQYAEDASKANRKRCAVREMPTHINVDCVLTINDNVLTLDVVTSSKTDEYLARYSEWPKEIAKTMRVDSDSVGKFRKKSSIHTGNGTFLF